MKRGLRGKKRQAGDFRRFGDYRIAEKKKDKSLNFDRISEYDSQG
jgi:hypothetical protein